MRRQKNGVDQRIFAKDENVGSVRALLGYDQNCTTVTNYISLNPDCQWLRCPQVPRSGVSSFWVSVRPLPFLTATGVLTALGWGAPQVGLRCHLARDSRCPWGGWQLVLLGPGMVQGARVSLRTWVTAVTLEVSSWRWILAPGGPGVPAPWLVDGDQWVFLWLSSLILDSLFPLILWFLVGRGLLCSMLFAYWTWNSLLSSKIL